MEVYVKKSTINQNFKLPFLALPGYLYWKDLNGNYLGCNEEMMQTINITSVKDIEGKSDLCFSWRNDYPTLRSHDVQVQAKGKPFCFVEQVLLHDHSTLNLVSVKVPLLSQRNQIAGTFGISYNLERKSLNKILNHLLFISEEVGLSLDYGSLLRLLAQSLKINELQKKWQKNTPLFDYEKVCFNFREAQCLHYFLNHYSAQKTSEKIFISKKTVEYHLAKIREKLRCTDASKISKLAIDYGFIDLMFMEF